MTEFNAVLKRAFAEAPEPVDDGFSARVSVAVAGRERLAKVHALLLNVGAAIAGLAVFYGLYVFATAFGQDFMASAGLEVARAHGALSGSATSWSAPAQSMLTSVGAVMTQVLLVMAALAGGAVAYRAAQD